MPSSPASGELVLMTAAMPAGSYLVNATLEFRWIGVTPSSRRIQCHFRRQEDSSYLASFTDLAIPAGVSDARLEMSPMPVTLATPTSVVVGCNEYTYGSFNTTNLMLAFAQLRAIPFASISTLP